MSHKNYTDIKGYKNFKSTTNPDGSKRISMTVTDSISMNAFENNKGKLKPSVIAPGIAVIDRLFDYDGHICFVDTNQMKSLSASHPGCTHVTGIYIFTVANFKITDARVTVAINHNAAYIRCFWFDGRNTLKPERAGWQRALMKLRELGSTKAKIFVDSDQGELKELSKSMLPKDFDFYYVSADRQPTIYNTIFGRLDRLTHFATKNGVEAYGYNDIHNYLWGNDRHLKKLEKK